MIVVIDFGSQYNQLIARRVRECRVYCQIEPPDVDIETIKALNPRWHYSFRRPFQYL